jgi:thiol-disulfide isomerase/thioredoxin
MRPFRSATAWCSAALALLVLLPCAAVRAEPALAPPWELQTPGGETVRFPADAQGQPSVLLFWPSWCPFSRALQPYVQDIWKDYRDTGVKVWTINILERGDPLQAMRERGLSFPLLLDGDPLIASYGISRTPWFVVVDGQGRIVYTRPDNAPSPIDVARSARETLNRLLGERALLLPTSYPPPYDLHLRSRDGPRSSRLASAAAADEVWLPWAQQYLAAVPADENTPGLAAGGAINDGRTAIARARELWSATYGADATANQAPYRAFRRGGRWLVAGSATSERLGQGYIAVFEADSGRVIRLGKGKVP